MNLHMPNIEGCHGRIVIKLYPGNIGIQMPRHEIEKKQHRIIMLGHEWYRCVEEMDEDIKVSLWRKRIGMETCKK